ncbi:phosphatidate cytidylyltransferas-like protein [Plenodomus tracheiphilus IPT5]|uniref:dolichol kinase n=1 Tax=Plenodomus tracheiphilus IPT5 TaxID=1408161 RepID=A0A6A7AQU2_9PLEO|nr:phosphatidate cytidylyltransferas-like protein [Plenodomus tracheiphilus IPT5]
MVQQSIPPNPQGVAPTYAELEDLELFRRSPHPYLRHKDEICKNTPDPSQPPSPQSRTPSLRPSDHIVSDEDGRKRRKTRSQSPSESGTEADDEGYNLVKALPAPPLRLHKGLRDPQGPGSDEWATPLLTPTQIDDEGRKLSEGYFANGSKGLRKGHSKFTDDEAMAARQKYLKRRRMELIRRTTETAELAAVGVLSVYGCGCWTKLLDWHRVELLTHAAVMGSLLGLYPLRVLYYSWRTKSKLKLERRIHLPAAFDPATILYPPILPVLISVSLFNSYPKVLLPNIILGLAALPARLIPFRKATMGYSTLHWLLSILPLIAAENTDIPSRVHAPKPYKLKLSSPYQGLDPDLLVLLFPLHQALLPPLYYLTTTSLLPAELHLLSTGLINLLLFSESPQASILKILLWMGGLGLFILCGKVLKWGVALARIPRWRLRRAGQVIRARTSFLQTLNESLGKPQRNASRDVADSDADEDEPVFQTPLHKNKSLKINILDTVHKGSCAVNGNEPQSAIETRKSGFEPNNGRAEGSNNTVGRKRRNTLPVLAAEDHNSQHRYVQRKRSKSIAQSYLSLTPAQATLRTWIYAGYFYIVVALIILGPVRYTIGKYALHSHEPFGWAISYLFGNIPRVRWEVMNWDLSWWILLPPRPDIDDLAQLSQTLPPAEYIRHVLLGEANTRLVLCIYCVLTILVGLISVFSLSAYVEVDTRRKVFHGTMVAMLLPTIYMDPCFVALALALVLAIFLLLDLIRASQLPPLSKPIAKFLTPYVDGRDLRGPVVVSHIFLLIGCAIPLWLSLAGVARKEDGVTPWQGWDVEGRDVSMLAGVVCVGMGDAAASLVGRRFGRRKWPWAGGKSLEGSAAFAVAVTVGLVAGKGWLVLGWGSGGGGGGGGEWVAMIGQGWRCVGDVGVVLGKAVVCAMGASLNEAVLTGGNDNVVVPVVLWVLVRGVRL